MSKGENEVQPCLEPQMKPSSFWQKHLSFDHPNEKKHTINTVKMPHHGVCLRFYVVNIQLIVLLSAKECLLRCQSNLNV